MLRPLLPSDGADVRAALHDDRVWSGGFLASWGRPQTVDDYVRLAQRLDVPLERVPYAVVLREALAGVAVAAGTVVGITSVGDIDVANAAAHIGWTAYTPTVWGTVVNPATKYALLAHCFDDCHLERIRLQTDAINVRSQRAIAALGATREGILRHHQRRADGTWRDTVVFSILRSEWPQVKAALKRRIAGE